MNSLILLMMIVIGFVSFWLILKAALNTESPILPVSEAGMCTVQPHRDCWKHPFAPSLHVGDLIIVQGVHAKNVKVTYPTSDILVFHAPKQNSYQENWLIVTRVVAEEERNGTIYFRTKRDGEGIHIWPEMPDISECDAWDDYRENYTWNGMISEELLVGKVVLRIPWIGHIALLLHNSSGIYILLILIIVFVILEFVIPESTRKEEKTEQEENVEKAFEDKVL